MPSQTASHSTSTPNERTALLPASAPHSAERSASNNSTPNPSPAPRRRWLFPLPVHRVFLIAFLTQVMFGLSQTSLLYTIRTMLCDEYYRTRRWDGLGLGQGQGQGRGQGVGDGRCHVGAVEQAAARAVALNSMTNAVSVTFNLFLSTHLIQRRGPKCTYFYTIALICLRQCLQLWGVLVGARAGVLIIQLTQALNLLGSPGAYQLVMQGFVAALAGAEERTGRLGQLSGVGMAGGAIGYPLGGWLYGTVNPLAPWLVPIGSVPLLFLLGALALPYVPPERASSAPASASGHTTEAEAEAASAKRRRWTFFDPLKIFLPRRSDTADGRGRRDGRNWSITLLGLGAALSVLATGYQPTGIQLYGTNAFGWRPVNSGFMLSGMLLCKAVFLTLLFPRIIKAGRRWMIERSTSRQPQRVDSADTPADDERAPLLGPPSSSILAAATTGTGTGAGADPPQPPPSGKQFDLAFLRLSILLDSLLTACVSLSTRGWHLYVAAGVLPLASGTGAACKGVVLDLAGGTDRALALGGIALVEKVAHVGTIGVFGWVFGWLSERGEGGRVFLINAAVAFAAFLVLCLVRLPR